MRKKILSLSVILIVSAQSTFALTLQQITDNAILRTQREANYGRYTIPTLNGNTSTIRFLIYETQWYEWDFKLLINNAYNVTQTGNTWFIQYLNAVNNTWLSTYYSWNAPVKERAKSIFWSNIYRNFLIVWNDPNSEVPPVYSWNTIINPPYRIYTSLGSYQTLNGKVYTLWQTQDLLYRFRQWSIYSFPSIPLLKNYIEKKNRIVYTAPNGRRYGIFIANGRYYFNRDNWSVSFLSRVSVNDTKAYINQHNQPKWWCPINSELRCY